MALSSCNNYLDVKPYGRTIPKTAEEFAALLHNRLYDIDTGEDQYLVGNANQMVTYDAVIGDNFETCLTGAGARGLGTYIGDIVGSNSYEYYYSNLYQIIRDCNIVLGEMTETGEEADKVRATAYAMRGASYYQLLRFFCEAPQAGQFSSQLGVPLVENFDMEAKPIRSSMQETIDQIESDLLKSASYKMEDNIYRFSEEVVNGYLCRLYFWTEQWDKALPLAQDILSNHPLIEGDEYKDMMTSAYDLKGNAIFKAYRSVTASSSESLSGLNTSLSYRPVSIRFLSCFASGEDTTDVRYDLCVNSQRQAKKIFFIGMRSAEFKLIEAECYYHMNDQESALSSINDLRAHRIENYTPITMSSLPAINSREIIAKDATGNDVTPLLALILSERRKELFLEGDRFFELKRNGCPSYWTSLNGLKYVTESYMYTFPIPYHDIELNSGIVQNDGYKDLVSY